MRWAITRTALRCRLGRALVSRGPVGGGSILPATPPSKKGTWRRRPADPATPPAIYGEGFVKPICRFKSMEQKSARLSPSPLASVDLPHLSRRPAGVCAFCRISLEPEAEGDFPTASVGSSWGRRERDTLNHLFGIVRSYEHRQERTSPGKKYTKDATTQSNGDPRWGGRRGGRRGHPSKSSRPPANRLDKTLVSRFFKCLHDKHFRYKTLSLSQSLRGGGNSLGQRGTAAVETVALPGSP